MNIGQIERKTQIRVVGLLTDHLGYDYLGDWQYRTGNSNIEGDLLTIYLRETGRYSDQLITRAIEALRRTATDATKTIYERNRAVYTLLRYGIQVKEDVGELTTTVYPIDWANPDSNQFGVAEEVALPGTEFGKRPDVVMYVNGIAVALLELKRSTVTVGEGIRQNISSQRPEFIESFFSTVQLVTAGNDTEGLRYGTVGTPQKYYLAWKELSDIENPLDRALTQVFNKERLLELIHDFVVFDSGAKKVPRHSQYFGVKAAQEYVRRRDGGMIWHTQGSGKSLIMVWLAKWIREYDPDGRVLIITDRIELDSQIEGVFQGVDEDIKRAASGADLLADLDAHTPRLMCSLIHKFGAQTDAEVDKAYTSYIDELQKALPDGFEAKGNVYVFVDECHRTQSGVLHDAMRTILPKATFIGFTGTPLLKKDKKRSIETFGPYIHTYKFDEAVRDGVIVDLKYEARDIDQYISSQERIDQWFDAKTQGLTDVAKARLKQRWGTLKELLSSRERLQQIAADIEFDMETRPRLMDGRGNALLVCSSIYEACVYYERFETTPLRGKCAVVTSYDPSPSDIKGEDSGEGETQLLHQYEVYRRMLADWFGEPAEKAMRRVDEYEQKVRERFVKEPAAMKLLIVVDKLLTGFDAPPATYLYIDKTMADHGLFQAICRVNRVDTDDKEYGYIIDYKDLFHSLETAVADYTSGALDGFDAEDVDGLLGDRVAALKSDLESTLEEVRTLVEPVDPPKDTAAHIRYFCSREPADAAEIANNSRRRITLYKLVGRLVRIFADLAPDHERAGYTRQEIEEIRQEVEGYEALRSEIQLASGDYVDLKLFEPGMRQLIDNYIKADVTQVLSTFDDKSFLELLIDRPDDAIKALPEGIRDKKESVAETIENNVRKLIIDESPVNPKYYEKMSALLDALIKQRREESIAYKEYLEKIAELAKQAKDPAAGEEYPPSVDTPGRRALYLTLDKDEELASEVDAAVREAGQDGWRENQLKTRRVRKAIEEVLGRNDGVTDQVLELVTIHDEY